MDYLDANLYHFRYNVTGEEVDSVLEFADREYAAVEIKLEVEKYWIEKMSILVFYSLI